MNDGKKLENLVRLIQETLKDSPNTVIYGNKKIKNISGNIREFDVFIESSVNDITIKIAIECKDYSKAVGVEKIEAFKAKCDRIPDINKKVFVTAHGYQRDAIEAAKDFGIELYHVEDVDSVAIKKWLPIKQLGLRFEIISYSFALEAEEELLRLINQPGKECWFVYQNDQYDVVKLINQTIISNKEKIWNMAILNFMRNSDNETLGGKLTQEFNINFNLNDAFITHENLSLPVRQINGVFHFWLIENEIPSLKVKDYSTKDESKAKYVEIDNGNNETVEIVVTTNNYKFFYKTPDGIRKPLSLLGTYDPKADKFTSNL